MLKLFALVCLLAVCWCRSLEDPEDIDGIYHLVYAWPSHKDDRPSCTEVSYRKTAQSAPVSCSCRNSSPSVHPVRVEVADLKFGVVSKLTNGIENLVESINNDCSCTPVDRPHDVIARVEGGYILHYVQIDKTLFLLSKELPKVDRRREITDLVSKLINQEGELLCQ